MEEYMLATMFLIFVGGGVYFVLKFYRPHARAARVARLQTERKVLLSYPILESDIAILSSTKSAMLAEALELRRQQMQTGRNPEATPPVEHQR